MRSGLVGTGAVLAAAFIGAVALADAPPGKPMVINEFGTYTDKAVWMYRNADGTFSLGSNVTGTNETLAMPSPAPPPGGALDGVEIGRHPFNTLGYPMHIALVEKLFAASYQIIIYAANADNPKDLWSYDYGVPVANERPVLETSRPAFTSWGPFHADAVPLSQAPEPDIQAAFDFAKGSMNSITNLPATQKNLGNYGVLFVDDGNTVWVEFGPRFAPSEAPHLGCQTQLGRDMVFGLNKKQANSNGQAGKFLQCF